MIHVEKDCNNIPVGLTSDSTKEKQKALLIEKVRHKFSSNCYSHVSVKKALVGIYNNKCAYCESDISNGSFWRVEHYRPKGKVQESPEHPGYYWLAYEWTNLLLSCEICNNSKLNSFPIQGKRVDSPHKKNKEWRCNSLTLKSEAPLLLNPELDDPLSHLVFNTAGEFDIEKCSQRGIETINICGLNRQALTTKRKTKINQFLSLLKKTIAIILIYEKEGRYNSKESYYNDLKLQFAHLLNDIKESQKRNQEFSLLGWYMFNEFDIFFKNKLESKAYRLILEKAYELFISNEGNSGGE